MPKVDTRNPNFVKAMNVFKTDRIANEGQKPNFRARTVAIPGVTKGHVSRLKLNFQPPVIGKPNSCPVIRKPNICPVIRKPNSCKEKATKLSNKFAKFLIFLRRDQTTITAKLDTKLAKEEMSKCLVRSCSVSTMATDKFGVPAEDQTPSTEERSSKESIESCFQTRGSSNDDEEGFDYLSDEEGEEDSIENVSQSTGSPNSAYWESLL